jgi:hypothetical protein
MRGLLEPKDESLEIEQVVLLLVLVLEKSRYLSVARNTEARGRKAQS